MSAPRFHAAARAAEVDASQTSDAPVPSHSRGKDVGRTAQTTERLSRTVSPSLQRLRLSSQLMCNQPQKKKKKKLVKRVNDFTPKLKEARNRLVFIRELGRNKLLTFLQFCTRSHLVITDSVYDYQKTSRTTLFRFLQPLLERSHPSSTNPLMCHGVLEADNSGCMRSKSGKQVFFL